MQTENAPVYRSKFGVCRASNIAAQFPLQLLVVCTLTLLFSFSFFQSNSQCAYGGINWGNVTPGGVGQTTTLTNVWGGDQYTLDATAGCTYTISTCGGPYDSQITVFDASLAVVAYNDDSACGLQSTVTFTAATTGAYTIQVNEWNCTINFTDSIFTVTIDSCAGGCNDPTACNYIVSGTDPTVCCYDNCVTFDMFDSFGDGWNGATYSISDAGGIVVASGTLVTGLAGTDELCLADGCYSIAVGGGSWDGEITWTVTGGVGGSVSGGAPVSGIELNLGGCLSGCNDPLACNYVSTGNDPLACCYDTCVTIEMFDSFGDGWDGAVYVIADENGVPLYSGTMLTGAYDADTFCLPDGCYNLSVGGGFWDSEITWTLSGVDNGPLSGAAPYADVFGINGGPDCQPALPIDVDATTYSAEQLITDVFLGDCLEASNITFTGATGAIGSFTNGASIGIEEGIILTSGSAVAAEGPNNSGSSTLDNTGGSSILLENMTGETTYDAAIFTFDFVASTTSVAFTYVFASEEYPEFVCLFNDAFGFFVSGPGYAADTNIALVPGTSDFVSIDNVNNNGAGCPPYYPAYYVDNAGGTTCQYDGYTVPLAAVINTVPCETYQITIAVADIGDPLYDSAVFLKAQSFDAGVDIGLAAVGGSGTQSTAATCEELGQFVFANQGEPFTEETTINFTITGTAVEGVDFDPIPTSITFQPGDTFATIDVAGIIASLTDVPETITVTLTESCTCSAPPSIDLFLCLQVMLPVEWLDFQARPGSKKRKLKFDARGKRRQRVTMSISPLSDQQMGSFGMR